MACKIYCGSCSLCPWCCTETCPHYHDHDNDKRYWVYVTDRKDSCYDLLFNVNTKKEIKEILKNLKSGKYDSKFKQKHKYCCDLGEGKIHPKKGYKYYPNAKVYYLPLIEITITDGEYSWYNAIRLLYNIEIKSLDYYENKGITYTGKAEIIKEWDDKIMFKDNI